MKKLTLIVILFVSFLGTAQTQYEIGMRKAFSLWEQDKNWDAANLFERIASAEPDNWLPLFYVAQINVLKSFGETDESKMNAQLTKAKDFLNQATALSKENADILILDALWHTAWIAFDGQKYGMKYAAKVNGLYNQALAIAPNHPIVILNKAEWDMGTAKYFNQDLKPYCKDVKKAIELFATFKPEGEFYPQSGLERAKKLIEVNCK